MQRYELDSVALYKAFASGGHEIIGRRDAINTINVFPVADGDTGTNLAMTMTSIINNSSPLSTAGKTMQAIADAALEGARGNSGIIFAQFLVGLSEVINEAATVSSELFATAGRNAEMRAREAILAPVEGTMLTVMRDWVGLFDEYKHLREFGQIFTRTLRGAKASLDNTPSLLPILKEEGVVDAGAEGFYHFLSGMTKYLLSDDAAEEFLETKEAVEVVHATHGGAYPSFRYCSEFLLSGEGIDLRGIRSDLSSLGECVIAAGGASKARVHIHTDDPALIMRALSAHGHILEQKVDAMRREYEVSHSRKYPIALVTDSVCDLPRSLVDEYQIHVVPLSILIGEHQYLDGVTIANGDIYAAMDGGVPYPSTAQPSPTAFRRLYSFLSTYYDSIIAIHVSGKLSGTYGVSLKEAEKLEGKKVSVIDSRSDSGAQALIVLRAAELIAEGKSHDEVVAAIRDFIPKAKIYVSVPTLRYMVKGGRVSPLKGALANALNLKPIVSLDAQGAAELHGQAFSVRRNKRRILVLASDFIGSGRLRCYGVVYAGNEDEATAFGEAARAAFGKPPLFIQEISPIIALNAGRNTLALVLMKE
ncbi:MAG TPA: DegV family protein [Rectinemataceae bacterium]|nr:DegV family protein [Rectinemataceae bacterium]